MTTKQIISDINKHLQYSSKAYYSDFYIGITNDVYRRLFGASEHNVNKETNWWIYRTADSKEIAEEVEKYLLDLGMKGNQGGGRADTTKVYCYEITKDTKQ